MEKDEKFQRKKIGKPEYVNENCWLAKTLNYSPAKRCQYCELKFRHCLFFQYLIISLILIFFLLALSFLIEGKISKLVIISIFVLVIIYGYFFNKSTEKIIEANFAQRKAKEALEELTENLQQKVDEQTKEIKEAYNKVEKAYEVEKHVHKELKRLNEVKSQFMMATQHHLRTPLTSIRGYLDLLIGGTFGELPSKIKDVIRKIQISSNRLIRIVNEFLDVSQFQLGKEVVILEPNVDLIPIIDEIVEELDFEAKTKGIYLKVEKPKAIPKIMADADKLKIALFNLFDNGIKYTTKGGVTVKLSVDDGKIVMLIKDTGVGISKEDQKNLFNRVFERGQNAKKIHGTGRGIGLYIAGHIINSHKGKVWAESNDGNGSTFHVELPINGKK